MRCLPITLIGAVLALGACAPIVWDKPGATQAQFNQENAKCRLVARGMNSGDFYAEGKPAFVAGAAIGNAVGTAISTAATYRDCMMATGNTPQNPQVQANSAKIQPIVAQSVACVSALYSEPQNEPIRRHTPFNARDATATQLADRALAAPDEIAAIDSLRPRLQVCQKQTVDQLSTTMPSVGAIVTASNARGEGDISMLRDRRMTWGEFTTRRHDRAIEVQGALKAELGRGAAQ
jgi:hypothetical protein